MPIPPPCACSKNRAARLLSVVIDEEAGIFPLTLLIDNSMRDGVIRLATPTSGDEGEEEHVVIDSPKFEYA